MPDFDTILNPNYEHPVTVPELHNFDIVLSSFAIKKLIREKLDSFDIDLKLLTKKIKLPSYKSIDNWLNNPYPQGKKTLSHAAVMRIAKELGIDIRITLVRDEDFEVDPSIIFKQYE